MAKIRIALLQGGFSGERGVSLKTAKEINKNLNRKKFKVLTYDPKKDLTKIVNDAKSKKFDIVIPALHGFFGEDGKVQGIIETFGIPCLFSGSLASAMAMDKKVSKIIAKQASLRIAQDIILKKHEKYDVNKIAKKINFPAVVKPTGLGSSIGITIAKNKNELSKGIKSAFKYGEEIMIEKYIKGREFTIGIYEQNMDIKALPVIEIIPKVSKWFDYKAKYQDKGSDEICPANISVKLSQKMQKIAIDLFKNMACKDLARVDFILDSKNVPYFIEINTIPSMTKNSLIPKALNTVNIKLNSFLEILIENNLKNV